MVRNVQETSFHGILLMKKVKRGQFRVIFLFLLKHCILTCCLYFYFLLLVVDSWGKIPPGLWTLNIHSYGQFDECVNIKNSQIEGKYCLAKFPIIFPKKHNQLKQIMEIKSNFPENNGNMYVILFVYCLTFWI